MPRLSTGSLAGTQRLNEWLTFAARSPKKPALAPGALQKTLRARLRMSQAELARRCGLTQAHIARLESGELDARWGTWQRVFDALYCDIALLALPRKRPSDALAEARLDGDPRSKWPPRPRAGRYDTR